jgi:uncharacterized membrane protein
MSELVVVGFTDSTRAGEVWNELRRENKEVFADFQDGAVIVRHPDDSFEVNSGHGRHPGRTWSHFWGLLVNALFIVPVLGTATTSLYDLLASDGTSSGLPRDFRDQIAAVVVPGASALFGIVRHNAPEDVLRAVEPYGGKILRFTLTDEDEAELQRAIGN